MSISFDLTPEQEELRSMIRSFAEKRIAPVAQELDETVDKQAYGPEIRIEH